MSKKLGFWSVFSIVLGSQIGTGVFMLPTSLAPYGGFGLLGLFFSALGAISLSLVFAYLCSKYPKTGGPHVYVHKAFGPFLGFFTGWTYWVVSFISTTTVVVTSIGYLTSFMPEANPIIYLILELALLFIITTLNLKGVKAAGNAEFFLGSLKVIPLLILPLLALTHFDFKNFSVDQGLGEISNSVLLAKTTLLSLWGFIGLESATAPAGSIEKASSTIPKAIVLGTSFVALIYVLNYVGITGLVPKDILNASKAPYADAAHMIFGGNFQAIIAIIASIICVGTLNAWILTSGQIALGLSLDNLLPAFFGKRNKANAPYVAILLSSIGIVPLLCLTTSKKLNEQITTIIDFSVMAFLFVYLISTLSFLVLIKKEKGLINLARWIYGSIAASFIVFIIVNSSYQTILVSSLFVLSGLPIYFAWYRRHHKLVMSNS